jgi:hypothetical protein
MADCDRGIGEAVTVHAGGWRWSRHPCDKDVGEVEVAFDWDSGKGSGRCRRRLVDRYVREKASRCSIEEAIGGLLMICFL